ncbi:MAG: STAS domain-containing protein [Okeania sp. SIO1H5]|uniref:STAS domain-containing protein n=1 Tax=Okeania sp. SIO1H5 TaxID=2607777 RepID=UPI0013BB6DE1|nr:STAS domain-containing protein [Okeania sp. SIO1H5]NET23575.1 STAS domain-containing protein [Okeania sp. SIO1H5]
MEITVNHTSDIALFLIKGKIGWEKAQKLEEKIIQSLERGCTYIVFNLDEVTFLGSGGIGALVYHMKKVHSRGGDIFIVSSSEYIQYLFATIGFNLIFEGKIFATFDQLVEKVLDPKGLTLNFDGDKTTPVETTD